MPVDFQQLLVAYERLLDNFKKNNNGFSKGYEHNVALEEYFANILASALEEESAHPNGDGTEDGRG